MANVARSGDTWRFVTSRPLSRTGADARNTSVTPKMAGAEWFVSSNAVAMTAAVAITEATDRSSPPTRITNTWPITTMPSGANCTSMLTTLSARRNVGDLAPESAISATRNR